MSEDKEKGALIKILEEEVEKLLLAGDISEEEKVLRMKKALSVIEFGKQER